MRESSFRKSNPIGNALGSPQRNPLGQPLDRVAIAVCVGLTILIGVLLWNGDRTAPQISNFSWQQQEVRATDVAFMLTFSRPMDHSTVEQNLKITPPLPGKISWAGRRMAYTLNSPAPYGNTYQVSLTDAYDRFANEAGNHRPILPFTASFSTPDQIFLYVSAEGEAKGRLILVNQTRNSQLPVTPAAVAITDFRLYPDGKAVLVSAAPYQEGNVNILEQQLYRVDLDPTSKNPWQLILDAKDFQNFKFDLSADGKVIVIQRLSRKNLGQYGLWVLQEGQPLRALENKPGGDFLITPDSATVAIAQGEGVAILPLEPQAKPLDFLPKFGMVLNFSQDGTQAAMVKFNKDYTRSLYFVTNQGVQKELVRIQGSILSAEFDPQKETLYALLTDADLNATVFQEQPYLAAINLKTAKLKRILDLKGQKSIQINLSPDGQKMLVSAIAIPPETQKPEDLNSDRRPQPKVYAPAKIYELKPRSIGDQPVKVTSLDLLGDRPHWLP